MERAVGLSVEDVADFDALLEEWTRLAARTPNLFATWEWCSLWWRYFGGERQLLLRALRRDGELIAILPLYLWRRSPVRVARFLGHGVSDQLGPISAPEDRAAVAAGVARMLRDGSLGVDVLVGDQLPADEGWAEALGGIVLRRESSPLLRWEESWDAFLASRSRKFRKQVWSLERKLEAQGGDLRTATDATLDDDLDTLFRLHRARWSSGGSAFAGAPEAFHRAFARLALERGWLRLSLLEIDGTAIAATYAFRFAGREWDYQGGRDPAWDRLSPGFAIQAQTMRAAIEDAVTEYRLLRGGEEYKRRFTNEDPGLVTLATGVGVRGRAATAALGAAIPAVRAWRGRRASGADA